MEKNLKAVTLYTAQSPKVCEIIEKEGTCFNKKAYIEKKYGDVKNVFLIPYNFFVKNALEIVPKPQEAEYPYWLFEDEKEMYVSEESRVLKLEVPVEEAVFFDAYDWNKILQMRLLGTEAEEAQLKKELQNMGATSFTAMTTNFYP